MALWRCTSFEGSTDGRRATGADGGPYAVDAALFRLDVLRPLELPTSCDQRIPPCARASGASLLHWRRHRHLCGFALGRSAMQKVADPLATTARPRAGAHCELCGCPPVR